MRSLFRFNVLLRRTARSMKSARWYTPMHAKTLHIVKESTPRVVAMRRWALLVSLTACSIWFVSATLDQVPVTARTRLMPVPKGLMNSVGSFIVEVDRQKQIKHWHQLVLVDNWEQLAKLYARLATAVIQQQAVSLTSDEHALLVRARKVAAWAHEGYSDPRNNKPRSLVHLTAGSRAWPELAASATIGAWQASIQPELSEPPLASGNQSTGKTQSPISAPGSQNGLDEHWKAVAGRLEELGITWSPLAAASMSDGTATATRTSAVLGSVRSSFIGTAPSVPQGEKDSEEGSCPAPTTRQQEVLEAMRWLEHFATALVEVSSTRAISVAKVCASQTLACAKEHRAKHPSPQDQQQQPRDGALRRFDWELEALKQRQQQKQSSTSSMPSQPKTDEEYRRDALRRVSIGNRGDVPKDAFEQEMETLEALQPAEVFVFSAFAEQMNRQRGKPLCIHGVGISSASDDGSPSESAELWPPVPPLKTGVSGGENKSGRKLGRLSAYRQRVRAEQNDPGGQPPSLSKDSAGSDGPPAPDSDSQRMATIASGKHEMQPLQDPTPADEAASALEEMVDSKAAKSASQEGAAAPGPAEQEDHHDVEKLKCYQEAVSLLQVAASNYLPAQLEGSKGWDPIGWTTVLHEQAESARLLGEGKVPCGVPAHQDIAGRSPAQHPFWASRGPNDARILPAFDPAVRFVERIGSRLELAAASLGHKPHELRQVADKRAGAGSGAQHVAAGASSASSNTKDGAAQLQQAEGSTGFQVADRVMLTELLEYLVSGNLSAPEPDDTGSDSIYRERVLHQLAQRGLATLPRNATADERLLGRAGSPARMAYFVVDTPHINATCGIGGAVTAFAGLLRLLQQEEESAAAALSKTGIKQLYRRLASIWGIFGGTSGQPAEPAEDPAKQYHDREAAALLAGILAHELGHDLASHVTENFAWMPFFALVRLFGMALDPKVVSDMLQLGMMLPLSRQHEREADKIGVAILTRACMDPLSLPRALSVMEALKQQEQNAGKKVDKDLAEYYMTHPATPERVRDCVDLARQMHSEYGAFCDASALSETGQFSSRCGVNPPPRVGWQEWCGGEAKDVASGRDGVWRGHGPLMRQMASEGGSAASGGDKASNDLRQGRQ